MGALFCARRLEADRWPEDGTGNKDYPTHHYDMCRPAEQIVDFVGLRRKTLDADGPQDVSLAPGETTYWYRFRPTADAIATNDATLKNLPLITSHGFIGSSDPKPRWYTTDPYDNVPIAKLGARRGGNFMPGRPPPRGGKWMSASWERFAGTYTGRR